MADRRVALIGYGVAGSAFHAPLIRVVPGLTVAAIVTRDEARRAQARERDPQAELLDEPAEIWSRASDFDLVVVAAPNRVHAQLAGEAIGAGLPVVVDKPLARTAAEGRELVTAAHRRGALLTVFQNRRFDGDFLTARKLIDEGALGRVLRFESRFERWRPQVGERWRELPDEAGGVLYDLGSHLVDQALQLFGPARSVYAELDARRPEARVDDDSFVALTHVSGVRSHLWMSVVTAQLGPRLRVLGDRAGYVKFGLDVQESALRAGRTPDEPGWGGEPEASWGVVGAGDDMRPVPTEPGAYQRFYEQVAAALRSGGPPPVDPQDAIRALEVLDAARASHREARAVDL